GLLDNPGMTRFRHAIVVLAIGVVALGSGISSVQGQTAKVTASGLPVKRLSSGALILLDQNGELVQWPEGRQPRISSDPSLNAGLDPRVGPNIRLGDDPPSLPANLRAQAEPHIARHPTQPDILAATFQEG